MDIPDDIESNGETETNATYDFRCVCGAEGNLSVPTKGTQSFGCPEGCGARYVQWRNMGRYRLKRVVTPIFETEGT